MTDTTKYCGGCMCGEIRYEATGEPFGVIYCHCESCRRQTGAPVSTLAGFLADAIQFSGAERSLYTSSEGVGRGFCSACGTTLTWEGDDEELGQLIEIHMGTMDDTGTLKPTCHIHHGEHVSWFDVAGTLPRYRVWEEEAGPYRNDPAI